MSVAQMEGPGCARSAWSTHRSIVQSSLVLRSHFATCAQVFLARQKLGFCAEPPLVPVLGNKEKF